MKKANTGGDADCIAVAVSRFGNDPIAVKLSDDRTVGAALSIAGVSLSSREKAYVSGDEASASDVLEDGDVVSLVTPKQAGSR